MAKIPSIIHYFWIGDGEMPELVEKCINSWKEKLPGFKIKCWNAENFNIDICQYTREAFRAKKYAFISDYVRLYVLYHEGGIYLDTDVEVLRTLDDLLDSPAFAGFENNHAIATCILGSQKGNPILKKLLDYYSTRSFVLPNGEYDLTPNPVPITNVLQQEGIIIDGKQQKIKDIVIYPQDCICPYYRATETLNVTEKTYCIHYFNGGWISDEKKEIITRRKQVIRKYGKLAGYVYYGVGVIKCNGLRQFIKEFKYMLNMTGK